MARQPILSRFRHPGVNYSHETLAQRPEAATLIALSLVAWTRAEFRMAALLAEMLGAKAEPIVALYFTLKNERAKQDAIRSIAKYMYTDNENVLFDALMDARYALSKQRNALAHGLFGTVNDDDKGVAWISPNDLIKGDLISEVDRQKDRPWPTSKILKELLEHTSYYTIDDLKLLYEEINQLGRIIARFQTFHAADANTRAQLYPSLCSEPLVARFLSQSDANQKSGS